MIWKKRIIRNGCLLLLAGAILFCALLFCRVRFRRGTGGAAGPSDAAGSGQETQSPSDAAGASEEEETRQDALEEAVLSAERLRAEAEEKRRREREELAQRLRKLEEEAARLAALSAETQPEEQGPPRLMLASDLHYMSGTTHDDGEAFARLLARDDGKLSMYSDVLLDALLTEAAEERPSALLLTGDNTLNGERENHLALAERLRRLQAAGVQVLILPGNHDIRNYNAATYFEGAEARTENLDSAEEFLEIYHEFGYDQALSRDPASLSYLYALDDAHWLLLLDTCIYEDTMHVEGRVREETLAWMEEWLKKAQEQGVCVTAAGHHNLLSESRLYKTQCTMENHDEVISLLETYRVPLYVSGHLHAQRIKRHKAGPGAPDGAYGVTEIVLSPYSIAPCQYGMLSWDEAGKMGFETRSADIPAWLSRAQETAAASPSDAAPERETAEEAGTLPDTRLLASLTDDDRTFLRDFPERAEAFTKDIIRKQVDATVGTLPVPREQIDLMENLYAELYFDYCSGRRVDWDGVKATKGFAFWQTYDKTNAYFGKLKEIAADLREDQLSINLFFSGIDFLTD